MSIESIEVTIAYAGQLAGEAGTGEEVCSIPVGSALADVLNECASNHGGRFRQLLFDESGKLRRALVISVNEKQVTDPSDLILSAECEVFVMTPIAGG